MQKRLKIQTRNIVVQEIHSMYKVDVMKSAGGGVLPYKRLMGMCRKMGSHFNDWIDYNGVAHLRNFLGKIRQFFIFKVSKCTR